MKRCLLAIALGVAAGLGLGVLLCAWVDSDWPSIDETDEAGA